MSPLGKLTFGLIGLKLFGADGMLLGIFLGHMLVDKTYIIRFIERQISYWDDVIRIKLPYKYYRYYNRLDGNIWGKLWGALLGAILYGFWGSALLFVAGHFVFDMPQDLKIRKVKKTVDHFFDNNWIKLLGAIIGFVLRSPILIFVGLILGFIADYRRLEGAKLIPFDMLRGYWQKINPLKLWRNAEIGEHRKYLEVMAMLAAIIVETDGKKNEKERKMFCHLFAVKENQISKVADIFENKSKRKFDLNKCIDVLEELTRENEDLKEISLENLFKIAAADEKIGEKEMAILQNIADGIFLNDKIFAKLRKLFEPKPIDKKLAKHFEVLGLAQDASLAEIKAKWKKLIVLYHPDKMGKASKKDIKAATQKMAEINLAYQEIVKAKSKK